MNKKVLAITKINLKNIKISYFVTGLIFVATTLQTLIYAIIMANGVSVSQGTLSGGMYFWLLIIIAAIEISTNNFRKMMNLGGKRDDFFWGSLATYLVLAGIISLISTAYYFIIDQMFINTGNFIGINAFIENTSLINGHYVFFNLIELFGWNEHGIIVVFLLQFTFLLLIAVAIHTLFAIQDKWYGWVTDIVIAAILGTFIPIAPLREWLLWFLRLIAFNSNAVIQIAACLLLTSIIYALNKPIIARKAI